MAVVVAVWALADYFSAAALVIRAAADFLAVKGAATVDSVGVAAATERGVVSTAA